MTKQSRRRLHRRSIAVVTVLALSASSSRHTFGVGPTISEAFAPSPALATTSSSRRSISAFIPANGDVSSARSNMKYNPSTSRVVRFMSDGVGGGLGDRPPPGGGNGGSGGGGPGKRDGMDGFLGRDDGESENLRAAREKIAEDSLPVSFGVERENNNGSKNEKKEAGANDADNSKAAKGSELARAAGVDPAAAALDLKDNPYLEVVSRLSPSDLISKFTTTAHPRVQDAVRSTILGLIGNLPKMAFDTTTITTGERLASLMFQLQMTGYMFKNAEYRISLAQSLGMEHMPMAEDLAKNGYLLEGTLSPHEDEGEDEVSPIKLDGKIKGKIRVKYGGAPADADSDVDEEKKEVEEPKEDATSASSGGIGGMDVEVDAAAYMSELRDEVARLKEELTNTRKTKDDAVKKDLLLYIRTMPREELASLTGTISPDVLSAMKGLVNVVMSGIGEGRIGPDTITEQSGEAMAQLCMWQLVVGYNLRELEVREEMRAALSGSPPEDGRDENDRIWYGSG